MTASTSSPRETLASCILISQRLQATLSSSSLFVLHRRKWQCLASSYCVVLQPLFQLFEDACSILGPMELEIMCCKLAGPLHTLHQAVQEAETCMQDFSPASSSSNHSWLVDKALKVGMSTDVVDVHLHDLLWTSSAVREQILRFPALNGMASDLLQQTIDLCQIWAQVGDAQDDLLTAQSLLNKIKGEEEGEASHLVDFILQKLSLAENLDPLTTRDVLPPFFWVDPEDLRRNQELLGRGGYAQVHEAVWLGGRFAVKEFLYVEDNVVFGREAAIQARLCHPNVIPLVCCTKSPALHKCSLVMELMQQDLRVLLMQRMEAGMDPPFPLVVAVDLMLQIAKGMEYLHSDSLRVIHRDLKSSNILVSFPRGNMIDSSSADGVTPHVHLKIADFGMSKAKYASSRYTTRHTGTTQWRAPEVFETDPEDEMEGAKYTNKADVYSFGLVCYEILTGQIPFEGPRVRKRVMAGERPSLPPHCPPALSSYIERCWHTQPTRRPAFTQICRMLRYFKACILLQDHQIQDAAQKNWLFRPLFPTLCARIDDMCQSFVEPFGALLQPQPLSIPLEMYCCGVVLQESDGAEISSSKHGESTYNVCTDDETNMDVSTHASPGFDILINNSTSTTKYRLNGLGLDKSSWKAKGHFSGSFRWLKKSLSWMTAARHDKSGLRDALGLLGDFSYEELRAATNNFSCVIGRGGFGQVYLGELAHGRKIAVKKAVPLWNGDSNMALLQELVIASRLRHRSIVPLFGWCQYRGELLLVYEFMPNGDLGSQIFQKRDIVFGWQQRYKAVSQLASALKYLHQDSGVVQIVHRDVKTINVLLDSEWNARLGDCCVAVFLKNGSAVETPAGTFPFLAPEAFTRGGIVSAASDIYSYGVTVLEIVCGRRAFDSKEVEAHICAYFGKLYMQGKVMEAVDARLEGKFDEEEVERLLVLALACVNEDPQTRPTIEEVLSILSGASDPPPPIISAEWNTLGLQDTLQCLSWCSASSGKVLDKQSKGCPLASSRGTCEVCVRALGPRNCGCGSEGVLPLSLYKQTRMQFPRWTRRQETLC